MTVVDLACPDKCVRCESWCEDMFRGRADVQVRVVASHYWHQSELSKTEKKENEIRGGLKSCAIITSYISVKCNKRKL